MSIASGPVAARVRFLPSSRPVVALDRTVLEARRQGRHVAVAGLDAAGATLVERFGVHDKNGAATQRSP